MRSGEKRNPLMGLKMFGPLQELCDGLRLQKAHPNRNLHLDDYLSLMLLAFFNPAITGLRQLVELPEYPVVNRNLGLTHTSLGSFSEASAVFDPEPLRRIFMELSKEACATNGPRRPAGLPKEIRVLIADGSIWKLLPRMVPELYRGAASRARKAEFKAHVVFNVFGHVPTDCIVTDGDVDERHVLPLQMESGALYVLDRGYHSYPLYQQILQAENSLVARLRCDSKYEVLEDLPLTQEAQAAGVTLDQRVRLLSYHEALERPLRVVRARVVCPESKNLDPKHKRGKYAAVREETSYELILLTDRFDLTAEEVLTIYKQRWQIEIFFRWFKCVLKCRHLFSETANGFALQMYSALIASLLVVIYTRRKPNKMLLWTLQLYFQGIASLAQVEAKVKKCKLLVN
jgi:hypothetical protein